MAFIFLFMYIYNKKINRYVEPFNTKAMETQRLSIEKLAATSGVLICIAMIVYFMTMTYLHLAHIAELRFLNFLIATSGAYASIRYYNTKTQSHIQYLNGLMLSFLSILVSAVLFALFIYFYFAQANPGLLDVIRVDAPIMGQNLSAFTASITVIAEGIVSAMVISFCLMQYFKDDTLHNPLAHRDRLVREPERE